MQDIVWSYAGVRPLKDDKSLNLSKITRGYEIELNTFEESAPLLSIFGGKITTYRKLAENAINQLQSFFPHMKNAWTANNYLPGGDLPQQNFEQFLSQIWQEYLWLDRKIISRYANQYGTRVHQLLKNCHKVSDMGISFGFGLFEQELIYLIEQEWAQTVDDILWRRTKLGLYFDEVNITSLHNWLDNLRK